MYSSHFLNQRFYKCLTIWWYQREQSSGRHFAEDLSKHSDDNSNNANFKIKDPSKMCSWCRSEGFKTQMLKCVVIKMCADGAPVWLECFHLDTRLQQQQKQRRWIQQSWREGNSVLSDLSLHLQCGPGLGRSNWSGLKQTGWIDRESGWVVFSTSSLRRPIKGMWTKQEIRQTFGRAHAFGHAVMED